MALMTERSAKRFPFARSRAALDERGHERRNEGGVHLAVAVEFDHDVRSEFEGLRESGFHRGADTAVRRMRADEDAGISRRRNGGADSVRGSVVHDDHVTDVRWDLFDH
jgi:hypothetical protein